MWADRVDKPRPTIPALPAVKKTVPQPSSTPPTSSSTQEPETTTTHQPGLDLNVKSLLSDADDDDLFKVMSMVKQVREMSLTGQFSSDEERKKKAEQVAKLLQMAMGGEEEDEWDNDFDDLEVRRHRGGGGRSWECGSSASYYEERSDE